MTLPGCALFGFAAAAAPLPPVRYAYAGLKGQSVCVVVWVDRPIRIDNPTIALDIATGIQNRLMAAVKDKKEDVEASTYPIQPRSVIRYQAEHPEMDATPIMEVAPVFNTDRVIYVEVNEFSTRPQASIEMYRGTLLASVKVVEVDKAGKPKMGFQQNDIRVNFPPKGPPEGSLGSNDVKYYQGTVDSAAKEIAELFYTHDAPDDF